MNSKRFGILLIGVLSVIAGLTGLLGAQEIQSSIAANENQGIHYAKGYAGRLLVHPSVPSDAAGIRFDSRNRLYVASLLSQRISVLDADTGRVLCSYGTEQGITTPDDLAFGPDGSAYITSVLNGKILRLKEGVVSEVAQLAPGVDGITVSRDGRLFVAQFLFSDNIYELDPNGVRPPRLITGGLPGMEAIDLGPDQALYVPLMFTGQVVRVDVESGAVTPVAADFAAPVAVKFDRYGQMYVLENKTGNVIRVNAMTGAKQCIAVTKEGADNMAFDAHGRLFVSNYIDASIREVLPFGLTRTVVPAGLVPPGGVVVTGTGLNSKVTVATFGSLNDYNPRTGRLQQMTPQSFNNPFAAPSMPFSLSTLDSDLVITSWVGNAVQVWDPLAKQIRAAYFDFAVPLNGIGFRGDLVVAELATGLVVQRSLGKADKKVLAQGLYVPIGLTTDGSNIWVSDWASGIVWQIVADGEPLVSPLPIAFNLAGPEGMTLTHDGGILVVETGAQRLTRIEIATGQTTVVASNLPIGAVGTAGAPPTWFFNGVAVDSYGAIYLGLDKTGGLLKIVKEPK